MVDFKGLWSIYSDTDPRWNAKGYCDVPDMSLGQVSSAYEKLKELYGEPPQDIEIHHSFGSIPKSTHVLHASIRSCKRIGSTGDSLMIPVTKEVKMLGLSKGDRVLILLARPENEGEDD